MEFLSDADVRTKLTELFPELDFAAAEKLCEDCRILHFRQGEEIFNNGGQALAVDWLLEGRCKLVKVLLPGRETVLHLVEAGHFLDLCVFSGHEKRVVTAQALTDCTVLRCERNSVTQAAASCGKFALRLIRALAVRERMFINKIAASQGKISVKRRLAGWILHRMRMEHSAKIADPETRELLAGLLGVTRESLSRQLSSFANEGVLKLEKDYIIVMDECSLRRALEE